MKGHIVIPEFYQTRYTDDYKVLIKKIANHYKWKAEYNDNPIVDKDTDILVIFATPQHNHPERYRNLRIPKSTKVIGYLRDIHHFDVPGMQKEMSERFKRYDIILSPAFELFHFLYSGFTSKMVYFPDFFAPYDRYASLPFNESPERKCFISGTVNEIYPLRSYALLRNYAKLPIEHLGAPWEGHDIIKEKYAKMLHKYLCCLTDSSVFNYTLAKYFEIPATGSLLIANTTPDLNRLGFQPYLHYLPANAMNVFEVIGNVIKDPDRYTAVRKNGRNLVLNSHSVDSRFSQFCKIVDAL